MLTATQDSWAQGRVTKPRLTVHFIMGPTERFYFDDPAAEVTDLLEQLPPHIPIVALSTETANRWAYYVIENREVKLAQERMS
jgi:hypothetical protein